MSLPDLIASRYRVVSQVGSGGMGLVYKAIDTRLDRAVAIKAINRSKLERAGSSDRLREEAMAAASLDHPFICRIYELVDEGADTYIVMEFVEGETLAAMMTRGRLPITETVRLFSEIAEGLANAHARGLVHRDIKPANVMITPHGHVKLLDFGIAQPDVSSAPEANTKTSPEGPMGGGGTPQYMSPEQATGAPVTARADLFSLGVTLYECLAGRLPFEGTTDYDYVHHLIASTPKPLHKLAPDAPDDLVQLVEQCLERTPAHRPESAAFLGSELRRIGGHLTSPVGALESSRGARRRRSRSLTIAASLLVVAAAAFAVWQWMQPHWRPIGRNEPVTTSPGREFGSRISPDGKWILFVAARGETRQVYVQQIGGLQPQAVSLPTGLYEGCVWSPDMTQLGCLVWHGDQLTLQIVPALFGGSPTQSFAVPMAPAGNELERWVGGSIYLSSAVSRGTITLQRLDVATGARTDVAGAWTNMPHVEGLDVRPDGREVVLLVALPNDGHELWVADIGGTGSKRLTPTDDRFAKALPIFSADGKTIVYQSTRGGQADLWEIDRRTGQQRRLTTSPEIERPESVAIDGSVSFQLIDESAALWSWPVGSTGAGQPLNEESLSAFAPTLSRDGRVVAFQRSLPSPREGFVVMDSMLVQGDIEGQTLRSAPHDVSDGFLPRLSPDGSRIAYYQRASTNRARVRVINRNTGETLTLSEGAMFASNNSSFPVVWSDQPMVWSPSSDTLFFVDRQDERQDAPYRIRRATIAAGLEGLSTLKTTPDRITDLQLSPDGRQLAFLTGRVPKPTDQSSASTRAYELHVIDVSSGKDEVWTAYPAGNRTSCRGWVPGGRGVVIVRTATAKVYSDGTQSIEIWLVAPGSPPHALGTIEHVVQETVRVLPGRASLYMTRSENGIANVYAWSLDGHVLRAITDNSQVDVTFANVEPFGDDRLAGVKDVRKHDIWLLDARATQPAKPPSASR